MWRPGQASEQLSALLNALTSKVNILNRDGNAAKPVFSRPCSCHVGAGSPMASRLVAMLRGRS
ncbi:hypothetical protein SynBIOSU31_03384 [Synechococcus sp. BIOS-U3-1]|nr:hypothetical protein SynBIOSU31_03384 [Synechococcus sp. BIOS-U3-1]